jgi:hypothetical protein
MALAVTSRLEEDKLSKQAGFIIDSSGAISQGRNGVYDNIEHIVSEFSGACDVLIFLFPSPALLQFNLAKCSLIRHKRMIDQIQQQQYNANRHDHFERSTSQSSY